MIDLPPNSTEAQYIEAFCADFPNSRTEVTLPSGGRVDCLTDEFAIEADWSSKWAEAIGQSMLYASDTGKKPAILIIQNEDSKPAHLYRLEQAIKYFNVPITIFVVE